MSVRTLQTAPVLSTPDTHIFEDPTPTLDTSNTPRLSDEQITITYEIERTVKEIKEGRWKRIALQFPDQMLVDSPRVFDQLSRGLKDVRKPRKMAEKTQESDMEESIRQLDKTTLSENKEIFGEEEERLFILADTSYGACCVDEVAAEHVDADVVVHYGRSCLSPPSRLPVVYVFTERTLDMESLVSVFKKTYPSKEQKIVLVADIPYAHYVPKLDEHLRECGYTNIYPTSIVHNPSSLLPNRTVPPEVENSKELLQEYHLFHISDPPPSLLLTLSSRVASTYIYPTDTVSPVATLASTTLALRRRYALLTSLSTTSVYGILINTLSVKNYMHILSHVQRQISAAGKKHYTFVVGKVNAAKVANFSEVGGWVVIGCWESSLIESKEFWRPIITPFELGIALQGDEERVWTGEWTGDFQTVLEEKKTAEPAVGGAIRDDGEVNESDISIEETGDYDSEEESAPPEFDLRTGRYVSHSRPMRSSANLGSKQANQTSSTALTKRANGDLAHIGGVASPGAEFLREKRTWQGLGSDFRDEQDADADAGRGNGEAARMEEGRTGIARGYTVGEEGNTH
ncbi:diphthamide biosynthesis protein 2 [Periconia macrospinosa]|uniref:2-(3-amino-3-carboxypropyl)histidine synthase subunit 2 n=1 Tax=Periconia macrospinosa TaxID=97972 RepID=A0A2V1E3C4_9PLEO|nr:diphthamide biosynthesis protein 2 [Periconia macrospinosa]